LHHWEPLLLRVGTFL
jgi:hypothetical protein